MSEMKSRRGAVRGVAVLVVGFLAAGAFAIGPAGAAKFLTKKKALKLFYTKAASDARFINVGEKASDSDKLDGIDSTGFLEQAEILVRSQDDGSTPVGSTAAVTLNTVSITAPSAGVFVISGNATANNDHTGAGYCQLDPRVGATDPTAGDAAAQEVTADASGTDEASLAYTIVHPVAAGAHTVTQLVTCNTASWYAYNGELTVTFVPTGSVARVAPRAGAQGAES